MIRIDLALAYTWEYDEDFVLNVKELLNLKNLSVLLITYDNLQGVIDKIKSKHYDVKFFLDRASDVEEDFEVLARLMEEQNVFIFNKYSYVKFANDKATMHLEFITHGINTPYTIIISPYQEKKEIELSIEQLARLGRPFIIKPANTTGGGIGVVKGAETLADVLKARKDLENDKYLLQEKIEPIEKDGKRFWFRCFYAFGKVIHCWWNDLTHLYDVLTKEEEQKYNLSEMTNILLKIQNITKLDFFSSEIALTADNKFIVIDYVNDQCDMRFKSKHANGVPDEIINEIINALGDFINKRNEN